MKLIVLLFVVFFLSNSQSSCDYELQLVSSQMGNFNTRGFNPLNVDTFIANLIHCVQLLWQLINYVWEK
jgi:hypothetical protein